MSRLDALTAYVVVSVALAIAGVASGRVWPSALPIALAPLALGELAARRLRHRAPR